MSTQISVLLHQVLDIYQREPDALVRALCDPLWVLTDEVPLLDQAKILAEADTKIREELLGKTLIDSIGISPRHTHLQREIGDSRESSIGIHFGELKAKLEELRIKEQSEAEKAGLSIEEYRLQIAKQNLSYQTIATEILRFFADRMDSMVVAFELLDNGNYDEFVLSHLKNLFRELHINFALGHKATTCILCGAILERSLKDRVGSGDNFGQLLEKAEEQGLLADKQYIAAAKQIYRSRNGAMHGDPSFISVKFEDVISFIRKTRQIVAKLYNTSQA
jgi:hypothetical protein